MSDLTLNISQYSPLQQFTVRQWETFSPSDQLIITDKINLIVQTLNRLGKLSNDVVTDWNKVMTWVMNDGMTAEVDSQLQKWKDDGTLVALLNSYTDIGDLTTLQTVAKDSLVHAINENVTNLSTKAKQTDLNTTNQNVTNNTNSISAHTSQIAANTTAITNNTNAITTLGSGSPKGTYATLTALQSAFPTGTTGIYIVTADGGWYYWSGSVWTKGGTYQSTGLGANSVLKSNLENFIANKFIDGYTLQSVTLINNGYYYNNTHTQVTDTNTRMATIAVVAGEKYQLTSYSYFSACRYLILDGSNNVLAYDSSNGNSLYTNTIISIPANAVNMVLQTDSSHTSNLSLSKLTQYNLNIVANDISDSSLTVKKLETNIQNLFSNSYTQQSLTFTSGGYIGRDGSTTSDNQYSYATIPISSGDVYLISGYDYWNMPLYLFVDVNGNKTSYPSVVTSGGKKDNNVLFTATSNGNLYINRTIIYTNFLIVQKLSGYTIANNPLYGKTLYADGDSISLGAGANNVSYVDLIANNNVMIFTKAGVSGTMLAKYTGRTDSILERVKAMTGTYDYILLEGGFNDLFNNVPIGTLTSGFTATLDETTVIGAVESMCKSLITNYPTAKKLFIMGHRLATSAFGEYPNQNQYWDSIITAFEKWSVPYIDLRKSSNLVAYNQTWLTNYFGPTETMGTHPNLTGYQLFYVPQITTKLKNL